MFFLSKDCWTLLHYNSSSIERLQLESRAEVASQLNLIEESRNSNFY